MSVEILTVSKSGQVALPPQLCKLLSIRDGDRLAAFASGDSIMLKPIDGSEQSRFGEQLDAAQAWAASVGYTEEDVNAIIKEVRQRKRNENSH